MLEFIASTARVSGEFSQIDTYTRTKPPFGSPSIEDLKTEITAGAQVINECLQLIGGISATWTDLNGEYMQGTFLSCRGFDMVSGEWRLDFQGPSYTGQVSATPHRLYDILLQNQLPVPEST
jgi:hypothetical protein